MSTLHAPAAVLDRYYRHHASFYDATRWAFLFGRKRALRIASTLISPASILEIGCGTGHNLAKLSRQFPAAKLVGIDLSGAMLQKATRKLEHCANCVTLRQRAYTSPARGMGPGFDLVLCSYSLAMFNPGWQQAIRAAYSDLRPGGVFALVDFHSSSHPWFRRWMERNHVQMEAHLLPELQRTFTPLVQRVIPAYGGLWHYLLFVGRKRNAEALD